MTLWSVVRAGRAPADMEVGSGEKREYRIHACEREGDGCYGEAARSRGTGTFKYVGLACQSSRQWTREVKWRLVAVWSGWRRAPEVT